MESKEPKDRCELIVLLAALFVVGSVGCSDSGSEGGGGSAGTGASAGAGGSAGTGGTSGAENPWLQPNNPACSTVTLEDGLGQVRIFFDEERVEAVAGSALPALADKGGAGPTGSFSVSAFEEGADCSTNQPGDTFSDVACVPYWNDTYIQAPTGAWFHLTFNASTGGDSAPVTMRITSSGGATYTLEATWGVFDCGAPREVCDELFGSAPSYTYCPSASPGCEFWFQTPGRVDEESCNDLCGGADKCVTAYDDDMRMPCTKSAEIGCEMDASDGVCECSVDPS